ncbi:MAG: SDR family oxidoreductase, partial [Erysipelotrichaceae bacterium]|nr:SDR family oxidoreductase [Erysipelotrichaceae bacterium]
MNCLITGATSGIGLALAKVFAKKGYNLILVSSSLQRLESTKVLLEKETNVNIHIYETDLSELHAGENLFEAIMADGLTVDILVNNAGFGLVGATEEIDADQDRKMMILNMISVVSLCKCFLPGMVQRGFGKILNIASTGAFQPGPYTATYFASKAFVLSYSKAIRYEAKQKGVQVCTICPGATKTGFFVREGVKTPARTMSAEGVAKYAYNCLKKNKAIGIPGIINRLMQLAPE